MFEKAARLKLRFETARGLLAVEDLWDLLLTSNTGKPNLDHLAVELHRQLKNSETVSFVTPPAASDGIDQLRFDLVKHVIDVRQAENKARAEARDKAERKQKILGILAERKDGALREMSIDELEKLANAL